MEELFSHLQSLPQENTNEQVTLKPLEQKIISGLRDMNFCEVKGEGYIPTYTRTDFTDELHDKFGFRTDYQIVNMKQMKKIFQDTKK